MDISWTELLIIGVVALIFIGPKELPQALYTLGKALGKIRQMADEFRRHFEASMREAGYEDLHNNIRDLRSLNPAHHIKQTLNSVMNEDPSPKPAAGSEKQAGIANETAAQIEDNKPDYSDKTAVSAPIHDKPPTDHHPTPSA